ncbi:glycosyltransferase family 4 protein [Novosphingobium lentum]|uniref:glycosyltransferase family 4 protein n=1 Tax=Novosphingobium lentum TaxID=145287 RepID=UPI000A9BE59B|nr:glycosyltransferase family 1 protein [Novosphingobium lentum]
MAEPAMPDPAMAGPVTDRRDILFDVSRLIWRNWSGRLPTGIDRACIAYLDRYAGRSRAVVQRRERRFILSAAASERLFAVLKGGREGMRPAIARALAHAALDRSGAADTRGLIYLNVGHTGLDAPGLPGWLAARGLKPVYLVHDLIPLTHPEFCRAGEADRHTARMRNLLLSARGVIANSAATLDDLGAFAAAQGLAVPASTVAWLGAEPLASPVVAATQPRPYFLCIGTIEGRKNHALLLRLWQAMARRGEAAIPELVLVGQRGWEAHEALALLDRSALLSGNVRELGQCGDAEMHALIAGARAVLMPSFAEGFGIPVIEALQHGTPVIASDLPVFREIADDIPVLLDPLDGPAWSRAINAFAIEGPERARAAAAAATFTPPTWDAHFDRVDALLVSI